MIFLMLKKDKLHPFKRFRPIAHGDVPIPLAIIIAAFLTIVSLISAHAAITPAFLPLAIVYLFIQFLYSSFLKSLGGN